MPAARRGFARIPGTVGRAAALGALALLAAGLAGAVPAGDGADFALDPAPALAVAAPQLTLIERAREALAAGDFPAAIGLAEVAMVEAGSEGGDLADAIALRNLALRAEGDWQEGFRRDFLASTVDGAVASDVRHGVPASITLAQAILESGWGRSAPGHNLFGMKGEGSAGSTWRRVVEYRHGKRTTRKAPFRAYGSVAESIEDHARLLATSPRYERARAAGEDVALYARALQGTYASDPRYARKLLDIVERYGLGRFDWEWPAAVASAAISR
jgi:hypothetical protein